MFFVMLAGRPPFTNAGPTNKLYCLLTNGNAQVYWSICRKAGVHFSDEGMDFFERVFAAAPEKRLSIL
jgi:hypothetical protein